MPLGVAVLFIVLGFTAAIAAVGFLIDRSAERAERDDARDDGSEK
jgi:hypothetical protein